MHRSIAVRTALLLSALLLAACASSTGASGDGASPGAAPSAAAASPSAAASPGADFPVTVEAANGTLTLDAAPEAIVSLSPTATEMLFAVDAGEQVVAADQFSNHPEDAPTTDLSGYEPNIEAIAGYEPDLVVYAEDPGDLEASLDELGIPTLSVPAAATLGDTYEQLMQVGVATGHAAEAEDVVSQMQADIDKIVADAPSPAADLTYYHELDDTYYSVTSDTFIGQLYGMLGLTNIADEAPDDAGGYPQLSAEFVVDANPDMIFLADTKCCDQSAETVAERPGWDQIDAVADGAVVELDDDVASRWGPRVVDLLRTIADAVDTHAGTG